MTDTLCIDTLSSTLAVGLFAERSATVVSVALILAGIALALLAALDWRRRDERSLGPTNRRVRAASGLSCREWRSLERLARQSGVRPVASLVISRGCFRHACSRVPRSTADPRLNAIASRLFSDPPGRAGT